MAVFALTDAFCYIAGHDFTGDSNQLTLSCEAEQLDSTVFGSSGWRSYTAGLKTSALDLSGFWQSGTSDAVDPEIFDNLGGTARVTTLGGSATEGSPAYLLQALKHQYSLLGQIGELAPFSVQGSCRDAVGVVRGQLAKEKGSVSATGATGTALELGSVSASQYVYATFHVFGTPGTTITAVVESDDADTFGSATTRITFGPITTAGGTWGTRVAGSITDTWWRLRVTAITGTFTVAAAIGIQ
jgi:hypothetical protein